MKEKLESLKGESVRVIPDFINDNNLDSWEFINYKGGSIAEAEKLLIIDGDYPIKNAYLDSKELNTLPAFYFYFPLETRLEDILMDNFYIGIKSGSIEAALWCLGTLYSIKFKKVYVTNTKPIKLKPYKLIHSSYREQEYINWKHGKLLEKTISKIKIVKIPIL